MDKEKEREFKLPESLVLAILNYLVTQPYQNVVGLINGIQAELNKQTVKPLEVVKSDKKQEEK